MEPVRWGVLGTAEIARQKVVPGMRRSPWCEVVAIASRDGRQAREVAEGLGIPRAHRRYEALLEDPYVEAVYLPLPNHLHAEWTISAARAGKHVLCEKPLALAAGQAEEMIAACREAGVLLMEAFMYRLHPSWVRVRELVEGGRLGELRAVHTSFAYRQLDPRNIRNVREYGGGGLYDIGCYAVDLSRMLFGMEPVRVMGAVRRHPEWGVDVLTSGLLEFPGGHASFTVGTELEPDQRVHLHGTQARLVVEIPFNIPPDRPTRLFLTAGGDPPTDPATEVITLATADPYAVQGEAFSRAVREGGGVPIPPENALGNLRVIEALLA